jgi:hypothetical protein
MMRRWASAVVCRRSIASDGRIEAETARRAVDIVVDRLRNANQRDAAFVELVRNRERSVAADADECVESHLPEHLHHAIGIVEGAVWRNDRFLERIATIDGAEDRSPEPENTRDVARREHARLFRIDQAIEAVFETDDGDARVGRRLHDRTDDRVQAGGVPAASENA